MDGSTEQPRRPTVTDVALALATRAPRGNEYSGQLTRNAKGDVQIEWGAKGDDPDGVLQSLREGFDTLCEAYPRADQ